MTSKTINNFCPRSGKAVKEDSLTEYRGYIVGFCNPNCRDDFEENFEDRPNDTQYFDGILRKKYDK
ncbi:YHS domain-containing protein [Parashewanella curva]|uniref:YHS domain-containing protein n=1 Tax=Parashewanella curva TaxID=2338552 RepID=A0A3L8Q0F2_9GAMM|nr:YHS domain-containing protein [Parashewanella curva]RLV61101.1 YHS domain-containing protein [Parashewanella curva]